VRCAACPGNFLRARRIIPGRMSPSRNLNLFQTMRDKITIYHNPRCSKSRETLALLQENGVEPEVVLYLQDPPDAATLKSLLKALGISARELLRTKEDEYKSLKLADAALKDDDLITIMSAHPKLIERPIVVKGKRAVLGRPPETVLQLLR
jgi:arsenate reductase